MSIESNKLMNLGDGKVLYDDLRGRIDDNNTLTKTIDTPAAVQSFSDGAAWPMEMEIAIEPVQSGTGDPSPSNVRPITGWDGAMIVAPVKNIACGFTFVDGGYFDTHGSIVSNGNNRYATNYIRVKPGTKYTFQYNKSTTNSTSIAICEYDENKNFKKISYAAGSTSVGISSTSIEMESDTYYLRVSWPVSARATNIQIEEGSTATSYISEDDHVYNIKFPGNVYGGMLTVNPDGTGELVKKLLYVDVSNYTWTYVSNGTYFVVDINGIKKTSSGSDTPQNMISNQYHVDTPTRIANGSADNNSISIGVTNPRLMVKDTRYTDPQAFASQSNAIIVCELATPVVYHLSVPQVLSIIGQNNNIWADCGDINSLTYVRRQDIGFIREDTAGQIKTELDPVKEEVEDTESSIAIMIDGDTAPSAIASGKYLFIKNHSTLARGLYHATSAIASGASITSNNTSPDSDGVANALNDSISTLNSKIAMKDNLIKSSTITATGSITGIDCSNYRYVLLDFNCNSTNYRSFLFPVTSHSVSQSFAIEGSAAIYFRSTFRLSFTNKTMYIDTVEKATWSGCALSVYGVE